MDYQLLGELKQLVSDLQILVEQAKKPSRAQIAVMAMQGLLACPNSIPALEEVDRNSSMHVRLSHASVFLADALMAELEKQK